MADDLRPLEEDVERIMREQNIGRADAEFVAQGSRTIRQRRIDMQRDRVSFTDRGKARENDRLVAMLQAEGKN